MKKQFPVAGEPASGKSQSGRLRLLVCVLLTACPIAPATATPDSSAKPTAEKQSPADDVDAKQKTELLIPKEESSVTHQTFNIGGQEIAYTATAGNLLIRKDDAPTASMFYAAYTRDGVKSLRNAR